MKSSSIFRILGVVLLLLECPSSSYAGTCCGYNCCDSCCSPSQQGNPDVFANLTKDWVKSPLYNKNKAQCAIQAATTPGILQYVIIKDGLIVAEGSYEEPSVDSTDGSGSGDNQIDSPSDRQLLSSSSSSSFYDRFKTRYLEWERKYYKSGKGGKSKVYGTTKSWASLIFGYLLENDDVITLDTTLGQIFDDDDDWSGVDDEEIKKTFTVREILTMTTGLSYPNPCDFDDEDFNFDDYYNGNLNCEFGSDEISGSIDCSDFDMCSKDKNNRAFEYKAESEDYRDDDHYLNQATSYQQDFQNQMNSAFYVEGSRGKFSYLNNWQILALIFAKVTGGQSLESYAIENDIFARLGVDQGGYKWESYSGNLVGSANGFATNARTQAKLGQLYLQKGFVDDNFRLINKGWTQASTRNQISAETQTKNNVFLGYGYYWFTDQKASLFDVLFGLFPGLEPIPGLEGAYSAIGRKGNFVSVFPKANAVISVVGDTPTDGEGQQFLLTAFRYLEEFDEPVTSEDECDEAATKELFDRLIDNAFYTAVYALGNIEYFFLGILSGGIGSFVSLIISRIFG